MNTVRRHQGTPDKRRLVAWKQAMNHLWCDSDRAVVKEMAVCV